MAGVTVDSSVRAGASCFLDPVTPPAGKRLAAGAGIRQVATAGRCTPRALLVTPPASAQQPLAVGQCTPRALLVTPPAGNRLALSASSRQPPAAARCTVAPALLRALWADSLELAREALQADAESARSPFLDHHFDPPLCCAVRLGCDAPVVRLLLAHRADASSIDVTGRTPLTLLSTKRHVARVAAVQRRHAASVGRCPYRTPGPIELPHGLAVATALLAAGGDAEARDANGCLPADLARATGNVALARLWQHYRGVQACAILRRAWRRRTGSICRLPHEVMIAVCAALAPDEVTSSLVEV